MKCIFRVKKDRTDPKAWTDSKETLDCVGGKAQRESGVMLEERCCLIHNYLKGTATLDNFPRHLSCSFVVTQIAQKNTHCNIPGCHQHCPK